MYRNHSCVRHLTNKWMVRSTRRRLVCAHPFDNSYLGRRHVPELYFPVGESNQGHSVSLFSSLGTHTTRGAIKQNHAQAGEVTDNKACLCEYVAVPADSVSTSATLV